MQAAEIASRPAAGYDTGVLMQRRMRVWRAGISSVWISAERTSSSASFRNPERLDGSEIHEAVCTLLALDQAGADALCAAPNIPQADVINHVERCALAGESRSVFLESARIARSEIADLATVQPDQVDALIMPGGFGAAKNLSTFATDGANCKVNPNLDKLVGAIIEAGKPIGAICIAPAILAVMLGKRGINAKVTIGCDKQTAAAICTAGCTHVECSADQIVIDEQHKIVSTPAYMLASGPAEVYAGVNKLVQKVLDLLS